jgi:hypothetical protein
MTVTYELPRLNRIGLLRAMTLAHEEGSDVDVGSFQAGHGNPVCGSS